MPIFKIDGMEVMADTYQQAGDMLDQARREAAKDALQRKEDAAGPLSALAAMQGQVGELADRADATGQRLVEVSDAVVIVADRTSALEAAVDAIPKPNLAQMNELAAQIITEGSRARNTAVEASAQIEAQTVQTLGQVAELQQQVATIAASADNTVGSIERGAQRAVDQQVQQSKAAVQDIIDSLVEPVGISSIEQTKPESFTITLTNGVVHEVQLPRGPRGYRGPQGATVGSGGAGGGSGSGTASLTVTATTSPSIEQELLLRNPSNTGLPGRPWSGPTGSLLFHLREVNGTRWCSGRVDMAAALQAGEESFTVSAELIGTDGEPSYAFRVVRDASQKTHLYLTTATACELRGTPQDTPERV